MSLCFFFTSGARGDILGPVFHSLRVGTSRGRNHRVEGKSHHPNFKLFFFLIHYNTQPRRWPYLLGRLQRKLKATV